MTRFRGFVALGALSTAIGAVPWALLRFGNWPINGLPSGEQLRHLGDTVVSDTTVFAVLTLAAWVVWAVFMLSVLVEGTSALRGVQAQRLAFAGPLQRSARGLVAAVLLAVTMQHSPRSADAGLTPSSLVAQRAAVVLDVGRPAARLTASAGPAPTLALPTTIIPSAEESDRADVVVMVQRGDTAWSIAGTHLGDGMRWRDLWAANRGVTQPDGRSWTDPQVIQVGWQLRLPTQPSPSEPAPASATRTEAVHTVVRGDTLSGIADAHLGDASRYTEIFELNRDVDQPDGRRLTDPNLILPGWNLRLPGVTTPTSTVPSLPPTSPGVARPAPTTQTPLGTAPTTTIPTTATPPPATIPTTTSQPAEAPPGTRVAVGGRTRSEPDPATSTSTLAGIAGALVLATGLALRIRFLGRRQATRGARANAEIPARTRQTLDAVVAHADVPLARWAGQHLAQLVLRLKRNAVSGAPVAVELSETTGIELLWDTPQPNAPDPWSAADGGWAWRLPYDPDAPVPADELPAAIPALVTIGHREGRQLMIDLEAYGTITVAGDDDQIDAFLRSVAVELATDQDLADAYLHIVGIECASGHLDRLDTTTFDDAIRRLDGARQSVTEALDVAGLDGTFAARAGSPTPIEATVVIARAAAAGDIARLVQAAPPRRGVAVIVASDGTETGAPGRIELLPDGSARLEPLGITFTPVALPLDTATKLDELLDTLEHAAEAVHEPVNLEEQADDATAGAPSTNGRHRPAATGDGPAVSLNDRRMADSAEAAEHLFPAEMPVADAAPAMLVRVLGTPTVPDRPELARRELILTVLLACRPGPVAASAAQDALWGGKAVEAKTVWNLIGATRKALGDLPDGTPVMPPADRERGTLRVASGVVTDLDLLRRSVERSRQAPSSEATRLLGEGLELVRGQPFDAAGYDWAHRDQDVAEASTLIEQATEKLVDLALDSGLVDVARDAVVRGLRGLPGNEELYRCRMRVEHHTGNLPGVSAAFEELVTYLADLETEPSASTTALYHQLVHPARR